MCPRLAEHREQRGGGEQGACARLLLGERSRAAASMCVQGVCKDGGHRRDCPGSPASARESCEQRAKPAFLFPEEIWASLSKLWTPPGRVEWGGEGSSSLNFFKLCLQDCLVGVSPKTSPGESAETLRRGGGGWQ